MVLLNSSCTSCIDANILRKPCVITKAMLDFFFVKRVMVLNRYQIYVKVIERSKGPSGNPTFISVLPNIARFKRTL